MKLIKTLLAVLGISALLALPGFAAEKTCCEKARAEGKDCSHPCCVAAHKNDKSCEKCNPHQEDLKDAKTCCEKAKAEGKVCAHKCCIVANKAGKVCEKCNPKKKPDANKPGGQNK